MTVIQNGMTNKDGLMNPAVKITTSQNVRIAKTIQSYQNHFFMMDNTECMHLLYFIVANRSKNDFKFIMHHGFPIRQEKGSLNGWALPDEHVIPVK